MREEKKGSGRYKGELGAERPRPLNVSAIGLEAEFCLLLDDKPAKPEDVFGDPRGFIREKLIQREGTSYHIPTGGAVYFDTGVIEVATPIIEIERGCAARAGRSLWESILFVRDELDAWETRSDRRVRLTGFSTHYNVSFEQGRGVEAGRTTQDLAYLLAHILPVPVMLLAANRKSTGIGVRPREDRIEVTGDFTPSPSLMIAAATLITGVSRAVMNWPSFSLDALADRGITRIHGYAPVPHTTRKGWVARPRCFPRDPFAGRVDDEVWTIEEAGPLSLRDIGRRIYTYFRPAIKRIADPFTHRMLQSIFLRDAPVLMDLPDRPEEYDDVGRLCRWDDLFPDRVLSRSRLERVLIHAIAGDRLRLNGRLYVPVRMNGWSEVVFERQPDGSTQRFSIDFLSRHLERWG